MAKSRTNSKSKLSKKSKGNVPKWAIAAVVVLVVAVAGYAIVRFSQADNNASRLKRPVAGQTLVNNNSNGTPAFKCDTKAIVGRKSVVNNLPLCLVGFVKQESNQVIESKAYAWWYQNDKRDTKIGGANRTARVCVSLVQAAEQSGKNIKAQLEVRFTEPSGSPKLNPKTRVKQIDETSTGKVQNFCTDPIEFWQRDKLVGDEPDGYYSTIQAELDPSSEGTNVLVSQFYLKEF